MKSNVNSSKYSNQRGTSEQYTTGNVNVAASWETGLTTITALHRPPPPVLPSLDVGETVCPILVSPCPLIPLLPNSILPIPLLLLIIHHLHLPRKRPNGSQALTGTAANCFRLIPLPLPYPHPCTPPRILTTVFFSPPVPIPLPRQLVQRAMGKNPPIRLMVFIR